MNPLDIGAVYLEEITLQHTGSAGDDILLNASIYSASNGTVLWSEWVVFETTEDTVTLRPHLEYRHATENLEMHLIAPDDKALILFEYKLTASMLLLPHSKDTPTPSFTLSGEKILHVMEGLYTDVDSEAPMNGDTTGKEGGYAGVMYCESDIDIIFTVNNGVVHAFATNTTLHTVAYMPEGTTLRATCMKDHVLAFGGAAPCNFSWEPDVTAFTTAELFLAFLLCALLAVSISATIYYFCKRRTFKENEALREKARENLMYDNMQRARLEEGAVQEAE